MGVQTSDWRGVDPWLPLRTAPAYLTPLVGQVPFLPIMCPSPCELLSCGVYSGAQIGLIVGTVIGGLIIISIIISIIVICCRQKALADKKTIERAAQIIGATEVRTLSFCDASYSKKTQHRLR